MVPHTPCKNGSQGNHKLKGSLGNEKRFFCCTMISKGCFSAWPMALCDCLVLSGTTIMMTAEPLGGRSLACQTRVSSLSVFLPSVSGAHLVALATKVIKPASACTCRLPQENTERLNNKSQGRAPREFHWQLLQSGYLDASGKY